VDKTAIRNAATIIVLRQDHGETRVLMGKRGAKAAFMPNKFVFPGGAVDVDDANIPLHAGIDAVCAERLGEQGDPNLIHPLCVAAIRELWEETGLILGQKGSWNGDIPDDWVTYAGHGYIPDASALKFVFRAITPPGRPRRFDARFFMIDASAIASDLDDFSAACDELSHLSWIPLDEVRKFDLPFITEVILAEVKRHGNPSKAPATVPFYKNNDEENLFIQLHGHPPTD
jgi:8-oxo-dGTP pyrophosphatase MutT (NUDIX family)